MKLEKNKVYKIINNNFNERYGWKRGYIICSPQNDVIIQNDIIIQDGVIINYLNYRCVSFKTHFVIGFNEKIYLDVWTSFDKDICNYVEITPKDYEEIRHVIDAYNAKHNTKILYNRKKNCLVFNNGTKEGKSI